MAVVQLSAAEREPAATAPATGHPYEGLTCWCHIAVIVGKPTALCVCRKIVRPTRSSRHHSPSGFWFSEPFFPYLRQYIAFVGSLLWLGWIGMACYMLEGTAGFLS